MRLRLSSLLATILVASSGIVGCAAAPPPMAAPPAAAPAPAPAPTPIAAPAPPKSEPVAAPEPVAEPEPVAAPAPAEAKEWKGKLLTKPNKGVFQAELSTQPNVGDSVELLRQVDASVPFVGGSWLAIADAEVTKVEGKKVTLKMQREKATMKINGKKLDHFTPGVAVRVHPSTPEK